MYYQLTNSDTGEELGVVKITNKTITADFDEEIRESWNEFHVLEEHELDSCSVDDFIKWNNENRITQVDRIFLEVL